MMILNGEDENSKLTKVMLADNGIDCCGTVVDVELEEGEIVDDNDDQVNQVPVDRIAEPRRYKINRSWLMNERSAEKVCGRESYEDLYHGIKRNVCYLSDDDNWSEDCVVHNKRRRFNTFHEEHAVERFDKKKNVNDGYCEREASYDDNHKPVSFPRELEGNGCDFKNWRHLRSNQKSSNNVVYHHRINNRRGMSSTTRCSHIEPATNVQKIMKLCRYYQSNRYCDKQDRCMYMHGEFPCKFHHTGKRCYSGDKCRYSHDAIDNNKKKLLFKNTFKEHSRPLMRNNCNVGKNKFPSLLDMQIPVPDRLKETCNSKTIVPSTPQQEPTVENIFASTEEVTATPIVYPSASENYKESSDDDDENDNLVIDEDA